MKHIFDRALGRELSESQHTSLHRYGAWLVSEGVQAGGIGPSEADRVDHRHVADSLVYGRFLTGSGPVHDIGSGAGMPGIPLAIAFPDRTFVLTDRSERRVDLLERAIRTLGLANATSLRTEAEALVGSVDLAVARAVFQPEDWPKRARRLLRPGGRCIVGVSATSVTPPSTAEILVERHEIGPEVLDRPVSFLTMTKRE